MVPAAGCSARVETVLVPQVIPSYPPDLLLQPVPLPEWRGAVNADLLEYAQELEAALETANMKLKAVQDMKNREGAAMGKSE